MIYIEYLGENSSNAESVFEGLVLVAESAGFLIFGSSRLKVACGRLGLGVRTYALNIWRWREYQQC